MSESHKKATTKWSMCAFSAVIQNLRPFRVRATTIKILKSGAVPLGRGFFRPTLRAHARLYYIFQGMRHLIALQWTWKFVVVFTSRNMYSGVRCWTHQWEDSRHQHHHWRHQQYPPIFPGSCARRRPERETCRCLIFARVQGGDHLHRHAPCSLT